MPSPFPGMDPYLENPGRWPGFHTHLLVQIQEQLNAVLRPRYIAMLEERVYVSDADDVGRRSFIPDVLVRPQSMAPADRIQIGGETMLAIAEPIEIELIDDEIHDLYLNIIAGEDQRVVTVIELLSPTNKVRGSYGQEQFLKKRREVYASPTHWVEIDFLREGERFIPAEAMALGEYFVHVAPSLPQRRRHRVWPIKLPQRLPSVAIPLVGDERVRLDLQEVVARAYDRGAYDAIIDYCRDPVPPLPPQYVEWADGLLRAKGLRT